MIQRQMSRHTGTGLSETLGLFDLLDMLHIQVGVGSVHSSRVLSWCSMLPSAYSPHCSNCPVRHGIWKTIAGHGSDEMRLHKHVASLMFRCHTKTLGITKLASLASNISSDFYPPTRGHPCLYFLKSCASRTEFAFVPWLEHTYAS